MTTISALPAYALLLSAYHEARERDLRDIVATLPVAPAARVLDVACGDGAYARWIADAHRARVVALDANVKYLPEPASTPSGIVPTAGDALRLPFTDGAFDAAWCAQSLYSVSDPVPLLAEMRRVTRPGGVVAVLENDPVHALMLPLPPRLELAVRRAELRRHANTAEGPLARFYAGRYLPRFFAAAGLKACIRTFTIDRAAPLAEPEERYLQLYGEDLLDRTCAYLHPRYAAQLRALFDPDDPSYLLRRADLHVAQTETLALARV